MHPYLERLEREAAKAEGVAVAPLTVADSPDIPPGLAFLAEAALTQARMAQKQWGLASKMLVEGYGIDEHIATVIDMLEEINAKIKENAK